MAYEHVVWAEQLLKELDSADDKAELVLRARDRFNYLSPQEKADVFVYLLGRNRGV